MRTFAHQKYMKNYQLNLIKKTMKKTTLLKSLFVAIILSITTLTYAQDEPTIPEVTTMEEVIAALGENDQTVGVKVHFKNLEPIFVVKSLYTDIYMPDGTTLLKIKTACPKKFDAIGRYYYNNDKESGALGFKFEIEEITAAYAFHNLYFLAENKTQNAVEITNPVVVTAVNNNNVFVQYQDFDKTSHGDLLIVEGEHSLQIGDQITGFTATLNSARRDTVITGNDTTVTMIRNTYFNVNATTLGSVTNNNTIKYEAVTSLNNLNLQAAKAIQLPTNGTIVKEGEKYFYKVGVSSIEVKSNSINLDSYIGNPISEMVRGVVDYYNSAENTFNVIITEIKALDTNYATIAEWIDAAQSGITTGTLKNPVNVTLSVYQSYKSFVFIQDETGAICLNFGDYKENPIKTGDVIKGIEGNLKYINASNAIIAPIIEIAKENAPTYVENIEVLESNVVAKPIDVTIAELNADEKAVKEGAISQYANRLVRLNGIKKGSKWIGNNPRVYPLIQGEDTLAYAVNTLNFVSTKLETLQMTIVGIIDYMTINSSQLYSIYPLSTDHVHLVAPEFVPEAGMYEKKVEVAISMLGEQGVDYTAVYYTTDPEFNPEDDPNMNNGEEYTEPLQLTETTTIHAMATYLDDESKLSPIVKAIYTIVDELPTDPTETDKVVLVATVYTNNGSIIVNTEVGNNIEVYTVNGQNIYNAMATSNVTAIEANGNNVVIVRVNGKSIKVAVK